MKNKKILFTIIYLVFLICILVENLQAENSIYKLKAKKIEYFDNNNLIIASGEAHAEDQFGREIFSDSIIYNKEKLTIKTLNNSIFLDKKGNKIFANKFLYDLKLKIIEAKENVQYFDINSNEFNFQEFKYFENNEKGEGKKVYGKLLDKSSFQGENIIIDNKKGIIELKSNKNNSIKNNYTTCEKLIETNKSIKERCPDWSLTTSTTTNDRKEQIVYHKNAIIKLRNIPVAYTPYFSHPDPTVKRKKGFLPPSTKNFTDLGRTLKTPYFWPIDQNKDVTFTPILYQKENSIFLTEYRQQNENSKLFLDTSYTKGYKDINKISNDGDYLNRTSGSRNHIFFKFDGNFDNIFLDKNDIEVQIQRISQKNYLNVHQINTENIKQDINGLHNKIKLDSYKENKKISLSANIYENLAIDDRNLKYHYSLPNIFYNDYFEKFDQNIKLYNSFENKIYEGDTKKINQINQIDTESSQKVFKKLGLASVFKTNISNINNYNENVVGYKENAYSDIYTTVAIDTTLPLYKSDLNQNIEETLTPRIFTKYTTGSMSDVSNEKKLLNYNDLYLMNRLNNLENPETGVSIGYGVDYNLSKSDTQNYKYFDTTFSLGQVLKNKENKEMPTASSLNRRSSDIVGKLNFYYNTELNKEKFISNNLNSLEEKEEKNGIDINYDFTISNKINEILKNQINLKFNNNNNKFEANYYELNEIGNDQYIEGKYKRSFKNDLNFLIGGRKNLQNDYSENNYIEVNYESDCLKIGFNLSKTFYNNQDLKPSNNLTFFVMLKPFGQPVAPDLTNLISNN